LAQTPKPQSPIPNPQSPYLNDNILKIKLKSIIHKTKKTNKNKHI